MQSQCLVVLYEDAEADGAAPCSGFAVHDMAAGADILFYIRDLRGAYDCMCAVQPLHSLRGVQAHHKRSSAAVLRREHCSVAALTLLDGGSGNEIVVGLGHDGACLACI